MAEDMEQQVNAIFAHQGKVICGECLTITHAGHGSVGTRTPSTSPSPGTGRRRPTTHPPVAISTMTVRMFGWRPWGR